MTINFEGKSLFCFNFKYPQKGSLVVISHKFVHDQSAFINRMIACKAKRNRKDISTHSFNF